MRHAGSGFPMLVWAAREILRRPGRHLLLLVCLTSLIALTATAVLFSQALDATWQGLMDQAPDIVVRRIDAGGWAPLPAAAAVAAAGKVPGVVDAAPRIWGVVAGPQEPLTIVASEGLLPEGLGKDAAVPAAGRAVVGHGVFQALSEDRLTLIGQSTVTLSVAGAFPADSSPATDDLVWVSENDARALLGLGDGQASDLAVYLFRDEERQAVQADLTAAFAWPVHITDRTTAAWRLHGRAMRIGGTSAAALVPAVLALLLIIGGTAAEGSSRQAQWGLCKALGWTTADLVRLRVAEAALVYIPATVLGMAAAYLAVFHPPAAGITALWLTGGRHVPQLVLDNAGMGLTMLVVGVLVGLPYLAAVFLTTVREAARDPWHLVQAATWH